jgi:hypothetical protein
VAVRAFRARKAARGRKTGADLPEREKALSLNTAQMAQSAGSDFPNGPKGGEHSAKWPKRAGHTAAHLRAFLFATRAARAEQGRFGAGGTQDEPEEAPGEPPKTSAPPLGGELTTDEDDEEEELETRN